MNLYYDDPAGFCCAKLGEIDWSDGCYQFDLTLVFRRDLDGKLVYVEDSGCSCPSPFEDKTVADLVPVTQVELQAHLEKRNTENDYDGDRSAAIADLMAKVVAQ